MSRRVTCVTGCGTTVRLSNGDATATCGACRAEAERQTRLADEERQRKVLRLLVRRGAIPRKLLQQVFG